MNRALFSACLLLSALRVAPESAVDAPATRITVVVDGTAGETRFVVQQGSVEVTAGGSTAVVNQGQAAHAGGGSPPSLVTASLAAPTVLEPADGGTIHGTEGRMRWAKVQGAARFNITVARDPEFHERVATLETDRNSAALLAPLPEGLYHWRVAAVAANGVEGPASADHRFRLSNAAPKVALRPTPLDPPRLYWLRDHHCQGDLQCSPWLAVDTETGTEQDVHDLDLTSMQLASAKEKDTREMLVKGQLAAWGSFRSDGGGSVVLVVSQVQGRK